MSKTVNTILTITVILCMAVLLIYGYCAIQKLDNTKEDKVASTINKHINYKEEAPYDPEITEVNEDDGIPEDEDFEEYIEEGEEEPVEEIVPEAPINKPDAAFLVIAGSFKDRSNAETKVEQYKKLGISAEIVHLHNSKLHAICIAQSGTEQEANDTMSNLIAKYKIKTYVYKNP